MSERRADLAEWLELRGLNGLAGVFEENDIDLDLLHELSEDDLKEIGLTLGQRRRLQMALRDEITDPDKGAPTSPSPVEESPRDTSDATAERRHVSVMFVDMVGSTALAERIDPEEMAAVILRFQDAVSGSISRFGGHIAKFMGDGVLAYFGWPRVREDEVEIALNSGLQALEAVSQLKAPDGTPIAARSGIASGWVVVGDLVGDNEARERTIVGDTPNLAARLQSAAKPGDLIVSESTRRLAGDRFHYETLPPMKLKGYEKSVTAYRVVDKAVSVSRFETRMAEAARQPLVGRDVELSLLINAWRLAVAGEGQGVILVGEAGIGKSRLTSELLNRAWEIEHRRVRFQCSPFFEDTPLWPVAQQMRRAAGLDSFEGRQGIAPEAANVRAVDGGQATDVDRLAALAAIGGGNVEYALPALADLVGIAVDDSEAFQTLPATHRRMLVQNALIEQVIGMASRHPLLMVLEDAHWADPSTLELFELLMEAVADKRVMVLITSRPEGEPRLALPNITRLALSKLGRAAVSELIEHVMADTETPKEVLEEITARTDGVPLFIEELSKAVMEARRESDGHKAPIPASLHDSLMARLDRLHGVREIAQIAACIGREFDRKLLISASEMEESRIDDALAKLLDAELIYRRSRAEQDAFVFKHALVRDAAYVSLLRSRRRTIHAAIVSALDSLPGSAASLIGHHAAEAGDILRAVSAFASAGRDAARRSANEEAVRVFSRALELVCQLPEDESQQLILELQVDLSVPLIAARGYAAPEVETLLADARQHAEQQGTIEQKFKITRGLWNCVFDKGELQKSRALSEDLVEMADASKRGDWLRLAYRAYGSNRMNEGQFVEARRALETAIGRSEPWSQEATLFDHGEDPVSITRQYLAWISTIEGKTDSGLTEIDAAVDTAEALALPIAGVFARSIRNAVLYLRRDIAGCERNAHAGLMQSQEHGFPFWTAQHKIFLGWSRTYHGYGEESFELAKSGIEAWKATGARLHICTWNSVVADAALHIGRVEDAEVLIAEALQIVDNMGEGFAHADILRLRGRLLNAQNRPEAAIETFRKSIAVAREQGAGLFELRAAVDLALLQHELKTEHCDGIAAVRRALAELPEPELDTVDFVEARNLASTTP